MLARKLFIFRKIHPDLREMPGWGRSFGPVHDDATPVCQILSAISGAGATDFFRQTINFRRQMADHLFGMRYRASESRTNEGEPAPALRVSAGHRDYEQQGYIPSGPYL